MIFGLLLNFYLESLSQDKKIKFKDGGSFLALPPTNQETLQPWVGVHNGQMRTQNGGSFMEGLTRFSTHCPI
jgi:hypothetical protein